MLENVDPTLLKTVLFYLIGPGAGVAVFWLMGKLPLDSWSSEAKRYVSLAGAGGLAMVAYWLSVVLAYLPTPETIQGWVEMLFAVGGVAVGLSQALHGRVYLRKAG